MKFHSVGSSAHRGIGDLQGKRKCNQEGLKWQMKKVLKENNR
jgi:hypothetical protein